MKKFPLKKDTRQLWIEAVSRSDWTPSQHSCICEAHFASSGWLKNNRLKEGAVPSLFCSCLNSSPPEMPLGTLSANTDHGYSVLAKSKKSTSVVRGDENARQFTDHEYVAKRATKRRKLVHVPTCPMSAYLPRKDEHPNGGLASVNVNPVSFPQNATSVLPCAPDLFADAAHGFVLSSVPGNDPDRLPNLLTTPVFIEDTAPSPAVLSAPRDLQDLAPSPLPNTPPVFIANGGHRSNVSSVPGDGQDQT